MIYNLNQNTGTRTIMLEETAGHITPDIYPKNSYYMLSSCGFIICCTIATEEKNKIHYLDSFLGFHTYLMAFSSRYFFGQTLYSWSITCLYIAAEWNSCLVSSIWNDSHIADALLIHISHLYNAINVSRAPLLIKTLMFIRALVVYCDFQLYQCC